MQRRTTIGTWTTPKTTSIIIIIIIIIDTINIPSTPIPSRYPPPIPNEVGWGRVE